jgi:hypothetical protein
LRTSCVPRNVSEAIQQGRCHFGIAEDTRSSPKLRFDAVNIVVRTPLDKSPPFPLFRTFSRRIKERLVREAMSLSLARKRPDRSFGAVTALSASSLIEGSARVYISVVCIFA